jgi:glycosyltransferase involved in cell wall biosynthesis
VRIFLNAWHLAGVRSGVGRYTEGLLRALPEVAPEHEYTVFYGAAAGRRLDDIRVASGKRVRSIFFPYVPTVALKTVLKVCPWVGSALWLGRHDVYHETNFLPLVRGERAINTIYDLSYRTYPEFHPARRVWVYQRFERRMKDVAYIVTISEHARGEIIEKLAVPESRVVTVYPGCDPAFRPDHDPAALAGLKARYRLPGDYLLFVGTLEPRKNVEGLLRAYAIARTRGVHAPLVLAGGRGWRFEGIFQALRELRQAGAPVHVLEYVPAADLPLLYAGALAFAFPSLYEGFGIPPLEAMASGCPVVVSNTSSLPEVVGDAALKVDPHDREALVDALVRLHDDAELRARLRAKGLVQAQRFRWDTAARRMVAVYREVAA